MAMKITDMNVDMKASNLSGTDNALSICANVSSQTIFCNEAEDNAEKAPQLETSKGVSGPTPPKTSKEVEHRDGNCRSDSSADTKKLTSSDAGEQPPPSQSPPPPVATPTNDLCISASQLEMQTTNLRSPSLPAQNISSSSNHKIHQSKSQSKDSGNNSTTRNDSMDEKYAGRIFESLSSPAQQSPAYLIIGCYPEKWRMESIFFLPSSRAVAIALLLLFLFLNKWNDVNFIKRSFHGGNYAREETFLQQFHTQSFTVDILSVASINRLDLLSAQKSTFGLHPSVRNFFNVTERDDDDTTCSKNLTWEKVQKISHFCRKTHRQGISPEMSHLRANYARTQWLEKKSNPAGWMCAQKRPVSGLLKVVNYYKETQEEHPHYFIIMDDDTYMNMENFQQYFQNSDSKELSITAGCLIRHPIGLGPLNFTFPFGGYGTIFSKGSLNNLLQPIICVDLGNGSFPFVHSHYNSEAICSQIEKDVAGELQYFENGMSLFDLIYKFVTAERYMNVGNWTSGFCMHSDWIFGYFVNFYNISALVQNPEHWERGCARIEAFKGSDIYSTRTGVCNNERDCSPGSDICHYASADWMEKETKRWLQI